MKSKLILILSLGWLLFLSFTQPSWAMEGKTSQGAQIFEIHCAGCHPNGNNIIRRGKTLKKRALERNHVASKEAIATLITLGKNNMSAFQDRLTPSEIGSVTDYVWEQAQKNWR